MDAKLEVIVNTIGKSQHIYDGSAAQIIVCTLLMVYL